jgi:hypothetical protein
MRANRLVLPGEDAEVYQARVNARTGDLKPRHEVELFRVSSDYSGATRYLKFCRELYRVVPVRLFRRHT